ncbi:hypothetical protein DIPPA_16505 [Diplonema papillatum]|nr:hypothetical protein DIPPA_16505 [Diplonema papillatum]
MAKSKQKRPPPSPSSSSPSSPDSSSSSGSQASSDSSSSSSSSYSPSSSESSAPARVVRKAPAPRIRAKKGAAPLRAQHAKPGQVPASPVQSVAGTQIALVVPPAVQRRPVKRPPPKRRGRSKATRALIRAVISKASKKHGTGWKAATVGRCRERYGGGVTCQAKRS